MRLRAVTVGNFRCYRQPTRLSIDDFTALVGGNDAGKSTLLEAIGIFLEEISMDPGDACVRGNPAEVIIACEFDDLPLDLVIDASAPTSLGDEYLLNEDGRLEIWKLFDCTSAKPKSSISVRALHPTTDTTRDLLALKNADLKRRARATGVDLEGVDQTVNAQLRRAIRAGASDLAVAPSNVPLETEGGRQIWDSLKKQLPLFALFRADRASTDQDDEAQDPMKAAVREALAAHQAELDVLADHVRKEVEDVIEETKDRLAEMAPHLATDLQPTFQQPNWHTGFKIGLNDGEGVPINKRGSGVRRLFLINFFRAQAERRAAADARPSIIYAIEEPEASQHPDNQRRLVEALVDLVNAGRCQVIITTHTPTLARVLKTDALRYVRVRADGERDILERSEDAIRLVARDLGVLADHDVRLFLGVEGPNDIAFLIGLATALRNDDPQIPDLEALSAEGVIMFIPVGGSTLGAWCTRLQPLNRPERFILDRDNPPPQEAKYQAEADAINAEPNCVATITGKRELENYLHPDAIARARPGLDVNFGDWDDVPALVAQALHEVSEAERSWDELDEGKRERKAGAAKKWLSRDASRFMTVALLTQRDPTGELLAWLRDVATCLAE